MSHPTWVRGLKQLRVAGLRLHTVAPYVGAWIETPFMCHPSAVPKVAPYVGAWIETLLLFRPLCAILVAPYVGAWIETKDFDCLLYSYTVAPYVGAWIETILDCFIISNAGNSRTLRGCVD